MPTRLRLSSAPLTALLLALLLLTGCAMSRQVSIEHASAPSASAPPLPLAVHIQLQSLRQENPHPATPMQVEQESLRAMILGYITDRGTFQKVLDDTPDSLLKIDVTYWMDSLATFRYSAEMKAILTDKAGRELGRFVGRGSALGGMTRFSAAADAEPMNRALVAALEDLCRKIEDERSMIVAKLAPQAPVAVAAAEPARPVSDIDTIPAGPGGAKANRYAVVIGIEQYRQKLPGADFAAADAKLVDEYLTKRLGYPEENVVLLTNDRATNVDFVKYFEKWLPNNLEPGGEVFVYYSGHGAPNPKTGDAYLVPYDGDPAFLEETGYSLNRLYGALGKLPAKEIVVALDSCFSGAGGRSVIAKGARPLVMNLQAKQELPKNLTLLAASSGDQTSSTYEEKGHGLFTYFLLKGIKNEEVVGQDGSLDVAALYDYVKPQVTSVARKKYNNEQTPQLIGAGK